MHAHGLGTAEQLQDVETHLRQLQQAEEQIRQQLNQRSLQAVTEINRSGYFVPDADPAQRPLPDLLQEATVLDTASKYLEKLEASYIDCCSLQSPPVFDGAHHKQIHGPPSASARSTMSVNASAQCELLEFSIAGCPLRISCCRVSVTHIVLSRQYLDCRSCSTLLQVSSKE